MKVAITRPADRKLETEALARNRGWEVIVVPALEIIPLSIDPSLRLSDFDWLVVTSATGADILYSHFKDRLKGIKTAVVGPKTSAAFQRRGITPLIVAEEHVGEGLASELRDITKGQNVLVARAARARRTLVDELKKVARVREVAIYDTSKPTDRKTLELFKKSLEKKEIDAVVFTSSQMTANVLDFLGQSTKSLLEGVVVCAIGPVTASTLVNLGIGVTCVPDEYTIEGALDAIERTIQLRR